MWPSGFDGAFFSELEVNLKIGTKLLAVVF